MSIKPNPVSVSNESITSGYIVKLSAVTSILQYFGLRGGIQFDALKHKVFRLIVDDAILSESKKIYGSDFIAGAIATLRAVHPEADVPKIPAEECIESRITIGNSEVSILFSREFNDIGPGAGGLAITYKSNDVAAAKQAANLMSTHLTNHIDGINALHNAISERLKTKPVANSLLSHDERMEYQHAAAKAIADEVINSLKPPSHSALSTLEPALNHQTDRPRPS